MTELFAHSYVTIYHCCLENSAFKDIKPEVWQVAKITIVFYTTLTLRLQWSEPANTLRNLSGQIMSNDFLSHGFMEQIISFC